MPRPPQCWTNNIAKQQRPPAVTKAPLNFNQNIVNKHNLYSITSLLTINFNLQNNLNAPAQLSPSVENFFQPNAQSNQRSAFIPLQAMRNISSSMEQPKTSTNNIQVEQQVAF